MSTVATRPFLAIYIVWHPSFSDGAALADMLYQHYRRDLYENVAGGTGLSVVFRYAPVPGGSAPLPINYDDAETSAVIVLLDDAITNDNDWMGYVRGLVSEAERTGLRTRVFPVAITQTAMRAADLHVQAIRWDNWSRLAPQDRKRRLISNLSYEFCRMLRLYLEHLKRPTKPDAALGQYLEKVRVFLSHSKHDNHGEAIALAIRDNLHQETSFASFFDVRDIPAGLHFEMVLKHYVRVSAVIAIHTDSYSSREWCRREILEAKRYNVPLLVANCITDVEERGFPYMGNVPVVRMEPGATCRIPYIVGRLLDEVLKDFLWRCRVELPRHNPAARGVVFLPRPPELIMLADLPPVPRGRPANTLVYPDPPLGTEEISLFSAIAPKIRLNSFTEWVASLI